MPHSNSIPDPCHLAPALTWPYWPRRVRPLMNDETPPKPRLSTRSRKAREERQDRLAEALRENLRRRKAQARGRADPAAEGPVVGGTAADDPTGDGEA